MNEADLKVAFESRKPFLQKFGDMVTSTICAELESQLGLKSSVDKFLQIPPKPRVKGTDSFLEKALVRKPKEEPIKEITDQVGVRFVVLLLEDITRVGNIIQSGDWGWQKDRDHEQERLEKPDYFAYQSDHFVVWMKEPVEYEGVTIPSGMSCEVQIRTILQHAYAEMAHSCDYKPSIQLPEADKKKVKRSLAKGSALIETTDDVFKEIKNHLNEYDQSAKALLVRSSEIYSKWTGEVPGAETPLGLLVADTYRELLKSLSPEKLQEWADARPWLAKVLTQKRLESVFYRDSFVVLLGLLVTENEVAVPKLWPVDQSYLEDFYSMLGISTDGLF